MAALPWTPDRGAGAYELGTPPLGETPTLAAWAAAPGSVMSMTWGGDVARVTAGVRESPPRPPPIDGAQVTATTAEGYNPPSAAAPRSVNSIRSYPASARSAARLTPSILARSPARRTPRMRNAFSPRRSVRVEHVVSGGAAFASPPPVLGSAARAMKRGRDDSLEGENLLSDMQSPPPFTADMWGSGSSRTPSRAVDPQNEAVSALLSFTPPQSRTMRLGATPDSPTAQGPFFETPAQSPAAAAAAGGSEYDVSLAGAGVLTRMSAATPGATDGSYAGSGGRRGKSRRLDTGRQSPPRSAAKAPRRTTPTPKAPPAAGSAGSAAASGPVSKRRIGGRKAQRGTAQAARKATTKSAGAKSTGKAKTGTSKRERHNCLVEDCANRPRYGKGLRSDGFMPLYCSQHKTEGTNLVNVYTLGCIVDGCSIAASKGKKGPDGKVHRPLMCKVHAQAHNKNVTNVADLMVPAHCCIANDCIVEAKFRDPANIYNGTRVWCLTHKLDRQKQLDEGIIQKEENPQPVVRRGGSAKRAPGGSARKTPATKAKAKAAKSIAKRA